MAQVKKDAATSKINGFIRFKNLQSETRALSQRHLINGIWCNVRMANLKEPFLRVTSSSPPVLPDQSSHTITQSNTAALAVATPTAVANASQTQTLARLARNTENSVAGKAGTVTVACNPSQQIESISQIAGIVCLFTPTSTAAPTITGDILAAAIEEVYGSLMLEEHHSVTLDQEINSLCPDTLLVKDPVVLQPPEELAVDDTQSIFQNTSIKATLKQNKNSLKKQKAQRKIISVPPNKNSTSPLKPVHLTLEIGHTVEKIGKPGGDETHNWTLFLRGHKGRFLGSLIKMVVFNLPDSFTNATVVQHTFPFKICDVAWSNFDVNVSITFNFNDESEEVKYHICLRAEDRLTNLKYVMLSFSNPTPEFRNAVCKYNSFLFTPQDEDIVLDVVTHSDDEEEHS